MLSKGLRIKLIVANVVILALVLTVNLTDACRLDRLVVDGKSIPIISAAAGLDTSRSIFRQPVDSLVQVTLARDDVFKVDLSYRWPNGLEIQTNAFEPVCYFIDRSSGELFGLEETGRVIEISSKIELWDLPMLTSLTKTKMFLNPTDSRVRAVIADLIRLRRDHRDLYYMIDEVDFGCSRNLTLSISGLSYRALVRSDKFREDLNRFVNFVSGYRVDLEKVKTIDLTIDGMITCCTKDRSYGC